MNECFSKCVLIKTPIGNIFWVVCFTATFPYFVLFHFFVGVYSFIKIMPEAISSVNIRNFGQHFTKKLFNKTQMICFLRIHTCIMKHVILFQIEQKNTLNIYLKILIATFSVLFCTSFRYCKPIKL